MTAKQRTAAWLCISLLLATMWTSVHAQDEDLIVIGQSVMKTLAAGESATWRLPARDGAMFSFIVESIDGNLDPIITIEDTNENILLRNDDYSSTSHDAAIEGFTVPRNGTYIVRIRGYGDTSGDYRLTALPGYAAIALHEEFNEPQPWQLITSTEGEDAQFNTENSMLHLEVNGIQQTARLSQNTLDVPEQFFAQLVVNNVTGRNGWQIGLTYRQQGNATYYAFLIDHRGYWRAIAVEDGEQRILSDWSPHPAIVAGTTRFNMSIFLKNDRHEFLYDGQVIGSLSDDAITGHGQLGFIANTVNALGSRTSVLLDDLLVTVPLVSNNAPIAVNSIIVSNATDMVRELERRNVIEAGGMQILSLDESSARYINAGVSRFALASEVEFENVIVAASISWPITDRVNGCGLVVNDAGGSADTYVVGFIDSTGAAGLSQREGETFTETVFRDDLALPINSTYHLLLIATDGEVTLFVDGQRVGNIASVNSSGGIGQAVINYDAGDTSCVYDNLWVWRW